MSFEDWKMENEDDFTPAGVVCRRKI